MQTIEFGLYEGLVDELEARIIDKFRAGNPEPPLLLDFSSIQFIRVESLVYLVSFIARRHKQNIETKIKYYSNTTIRQFLNTSRFFETIEDVCGLAITDLVVDLPANFEKTALSIDYFKRSKFELSPDGTQRELTEKEKIEYLKEKGFYPLSSLAFEDDIQKSNTLKEEPKNWTEGKPIVSIIQKNLPEKVVVGDKISKHIIYESITNAIRHPKSGKLVISCIRQDNYYTLVIWDNGESIVETLMGELEKGNSIKAESSDDDFHSCYCVVKNKIPGRPKAENFDYFFSYDIPNLNEVDETKLYRKEKWFVLLSSLFPGITRDPQGADYDKRKILNEVEKPPLTGRGLTYLINAAVRNFGGEVRIRTSNYFVNIKQAEKDYKTLPTLFFNNFKNDYYVIDYKEKYDAENIEPQNKKIINSLFRAKVEEFSNNYPPFEGNMITVHIPQMSL